MLKYHRLKEFNNISSLFHTCNKDLIFQLFYLNNLNFNNALLILREMFRECYENLQKKFWECSFIK